MRLAPPPAVALAWLALGPGPAVAAEPPALTVFAAADLTFAFRELAPRFEKATGVRVTLVFGLTGNFAHQIREGGPADVFFAADQSFVDALAAERVLLAETRTLFAQGRIVLATPRVFGPTLTELRRSEEYTSELQSPMYLVCRLLLEKKKQINKQQLTSPS